MILTRRNRLVTVLFALVSLLFLQLAVAGYVCPSGLTSGTKVTEVETMVQADMPCGNSMSLAMDDEQPSLCSAHCGADQQIADKYQVSGLTALADLPTDFPLPRVTRVLLGAPVQAPLLMRTTAPPLAVRHCCFRI